jgi:hypothetical protein
MSVDVVVEYAKEKVVAVVIPMVVPTPRVRQGLDTHALS